MKSKTILMALGVFLAGAALCLAADANMGTWKLNEAKSKFAPGAGKNYTVVYAAAGDNIKVTVDGVDGNGKPTHNEWTGKFDGKDYPVTGDPSSDMRSYTRVDDRTLSLIVMKGGRVTVAGTIVVSLDGKIRTVSTTAIDSKGAKVLNSAVYDKP